MRKQKRAAALKAANDIVSAAKAAGRSHLTDAERETVQAKLAEVDQLDREMAQEQTDSELLAKIAGEGSDHFDEAETAETFKELDRALATKSTVQVRLPRAAFGSKATLMLDQPTNVFVDRETREPAPGIAAVQLRKLFPRQVVDAATVRVYSVDRVTGVDIVAEGELKPELDSGYSHKDEPLVKLAGRLKTSMEFDTDAVPLRQAIMRQANLDLVGRENRLILERMGAASGVLVKTGAAASVLDLLADSIGEQIALNGFGPTFLIGSPTDITAMAKLKASGSGEYLVNPFGGSLGAPFGLQTLAVPGYAPGTLWVGHGAAGRFYEHETGVMVRVGTSGDDFDRNITTTVIEERVLPAIEQPGLLTKITLT